MRDYREKTLTERLKFAVDFCARDDLGSTGATIQYSNDFYITKISSTQFEIIARWGNTYMCDQHGHLLKQIGNNDETTQKYGAQTLRALRIIAAANGDPLKARNCLKEKMQPRKDGNAYRLRNLLRTLEQKEIIEAVPISTGILNAPPINGYILTERAERILQMADVKAEGGK